MSELKTFSNYELFQGLSMDEISLRKDTDIILAYSTFLSFNNEVYTPK